MDNTTHVIPKENMTPYQRWQLDSLDSAKTQDTPASSQTDKTGQKAEPSTSTDPEGQEPHTLPTKEQIEHIFQQAQEDGYSVGFQAGRSAGYQESRQNAEKELKNEIKHIQTILSELDRELHQIDQQVAQDLLTLALSLSKKMIIEALQIRPEIVLPIVQEAIRQLPHAAQHPRLHLHPDDALLVSNHLSDELSQSDWKVCKDEKIERGGCRVDAEGSEVDASLSTRWQRILATIGQENNWLE